MSRLLIFAYGVVSYCAGLAGLVYFILFVGGFEFLPFHVDSGEPQPLITALLVNSCLTLIVGLQHSVMARKSYKRLWARVMPIAADRSTYVLLSGVVFVALCYFWQRIDGTIWQVENSMLAYLLWSIYGFGWLLAISSSFVINHFELFGLQQVYYHFRGQAVPQASFTDRFFYKIVRHPLQLGVLIGIWFTPSMSASHLVLSLLMTTYIFVGLYFEEKDLVASLGEDYLHYQTKVPMVLPLPRKTSTAT